MIAGSLPECSAQSKEVFGAAQAQGRVHPASGSVIWLPPRNPISQWIHRLHAPEVWIALMVGGAGILVHEPWVRWTLRPGRALAAWFRILLTNPERAPAIQRFTSLISPIKFPSESRKKTIHKSWSGILASRCGSSSKRTPFPFIFWCAAWMSATAK